MSGCWDERSTLAPQHEIERALAAMADMRAAHRRDRIATEK